MLNTLGSNLRPFRSPDLAQSCRNRIGLWVLALLSSALLTTPALGNRDEISVGPAIKRIQTLPRYVNARWGLMVVDVASGRTVMQQSPDKLFKIGSNAKLFTIAAALEDIGPDHRFETPVVRNGAVDADGVLDGDLILVATGDLTMGGRRNPDGTVAYTDFDHTDANPLGGAILTEPDPLAGLDDLAKQVAASGITTVSGEVVIDDRLFDTTPHRDFILSPIIINDNLIDLKIIPKNPGETAPVEWRPKTASFDVVSQVTTVQPGGDTNIEISADSNSCQPPSGALTTIVVSGTIAQDADDNPLGLQPIRTFQIEDPASFARTAFIEALERAGVSVQASSLGNNPRGRLPTPDGVEALPQVALLTSAPYREQAKLILKVSHNFGADTASMLLASAHGERSRLAGMAILGGIIKNKFGIDRDRYVSFDASGLASFATPRAEVELLRAMALSGNAEPYANGLPILGVDGSLAPVQPDSPAAGHVFAKTGTGVQLDAAHSGLFMTEKALGGYINSAKGRRLAFVMMVEGGLIDRIEDIGEVNQELGQIAAIIWSGRR